MKDSNNKTNNDGNTVLANRLCFRVWIDSTLGDYMAIQGEPDLETNKKHYLSKAARVRGWGQLTYGTTSINEGSKGNAQRALFNEFKEFLSFAVREQ